MSRLIDIDALLKELESSKLQPTKDTDGFIDGWCEGFNTVVDMIRNQPTAFDTEKVVEQLMIIHDEGYCPNEDGLECVLDKACSDCYREKVIDIVKKGWVK